MNEKFDELYHTDCENDLKIDVAIIGAGVSGLYAGYRLLNGKFSDKAEPPKTVHIFEMSNRIGGRLESVRLPKMDVVGELGGMRYMTSQQIINSLIENVFAGELKSIDFPMGEPNQHFMYLRQQQFPSDAWQKCQKSGTKFKTHYFLNEDDQGYSPDQLFDKIVYDVLTKDPWFVEKYGNCVSPVSPYDYEFKLNSQQWDDIKPNLSYCFEGSPYYKMKVNDIGFWNLIKDQAGQEGYQFLSDAGGYYSNTINWNAAEAFPYMVGDFSKAGVEYKTIEGGYDRIAYALAKAYCAKPGSQIWLGNRLETFNVNENSDYRYCLKIHNMQTSSEWYVKTKQIILALPRRSLELLDQYNFFFNPDSAQKLQKSIDSIIMEHSYKLLMGFEKPWWLADFGTTAGESITDLPMRQCYYFGVDPQNSHSLFLATYNDMRTTSFWQVIENATPKKPFQPKPTKLISTEQLQEFFKNEKHKDQFSKYQASEVMVAEAMSQVRALHSRADIPEPYIAYYKDWSLDPFGGGYHAWKAGVNVQEVMKYMRKPVESESIHICGEAYSDQQGWVEGALCVAEKMLQEHFSIEWPDWLDPKYYLGW
ncbi:amine oxidase (plasmid) [Kalymmatonema gypsitolerans NIES-4073]|nr:amine oxidase [Scytonema sp. NIES-4073]